MRAVSTWDPAVLGHCATALEEHQSCSCHLPPSSAQEERWLSYRAPSHGRNRGDLKAFFCLFSFFLFANKAPCSVEGGKKKVRRVNEKCHTNFKTCSDQRSTYRCWIHGYGTRTQCALSIFQVSGNNSV